MVRFCPTCHSYIPSSKKHCPKCTRPEAGFQHKIRKLPTDLTVKDLLDNFPSPSLRSYQEDIITKAVEAFQTGKKCLILSAPTGFGKSYVNAAFTSVTKSFYATPQIALIDQIMKDPCLESRFVEIKGRQNYRCYYHPQRGVHIGKCETQGYACNERFEVCPYWIQKMKALSAQSVLLSFAYLIAEGQTEDVSDTYLGTRSLLVLDEAHNIEEQCLNHISVRVTPFTIPHEVYKQLLPELRQVNTETQLREFLQRLEERLRKILNQAEKIADTTGLSVVQAQDKALIERFLANYALYRLSKTEWVWQLKNDQLLLQPVFAREFMKELVWKRADHYIISSATILNPQEYAELAGLRSFLQEDEICFLQVPSTFPVENRPILDATVGPLSKQEWTHNMRKAVQAVEDILKKERGNVAIHCHSYQHQRALIENISEEIKPRFIIHSSRDRQEKLNEWMSSRGKVFVSVAFNEGQDWKYDVCDAQILLKVPFPDLGDKRVKKRLELGHRQWYENQAMLEVIQAYGRAIRAEDDKARFYVVDGSFTRLVRTCWPFMPDWFKDALPESFLHAS